MTQATINNMDNLLQAAKFVGAGLATIGLAGAGVGIGVVFSGLIAFLLLFAL